MLFRTPRPDAELESQLAELDQLRRRLAIQAGGADRWLGRLRRQWRASSAQSSIEIEGFRVPAAEVIAVVSGDAQPDPADQDRMALSCYGRAMDHVGVMADDPAFRWLDRVILDLHFDACHFQKKELPGRYRHGGVVVTSPGGGAPAYVGPSHEEVPQLVNEVVEWLESGDLDAHVSVRAAMAHLHLVSVHPFRDGNGRISRILQSLVLAREGPLAIEFVSIEEYLGHNTDAYYRTLQEVQAGGYHPERDAMPWVRFCVRAQVEQVRRRLDQITEAGRRWSFLEELVEERGWPGRLASALQESLLDGIDRAAYASEAGMSLQTATNDLRRLLDAGFLVQRGQGRTTRYLASEGLRRELDAYLDERSRVDAADGR